MSKITFRADDELVNRLEALDGSKSEIMREALRSYLDACQEDGRREGTAARQAVDERSLDELIAGRVDAFIEQRLHDRETPASPGRDVNVNVTVERGDADVNADESGRTERNRESANLSAGQSRLCPQCGETVAENYIYCPNCGEKAANRAFCECGDEIRPDWAYCPSCGRRTPSADVLDRS